MDSLYLFDSVTKGKRLFIPMTQESVKIYVCGPTVYDDAHLGHARSSIVFDLLYRVLRKQHSNVIYAKNFTDIDDKILAKMETTGQTLDEITNYYIASYKNDMEALHVLPPTIEPKATENITGMNHLVEELLSKNAAYILQDGIYLDTSKDHKYGTISHRASDENSQARIVSVVEKRDPKDFALWKFSSDSVVFESEFGSGRPGWHCECSAMIDTHLSDKSLPFAVDIHGGGADLLFPHHENEASQTRLGYDQELANYWIHNGFVTIDGEKMSKSLGNSFFLKDALRLYGGEVIRFYILSTHYRADLAFNTSDLESAKKRLDKLYRLKKRVFGVSKNLSIKPLVHEENLLTALNDDLNTSKAYAVIDEFVAYANDFLDKNSKDKNFKAQIVAMIEAIDEILGIGGSDPYAYFQFGMSETLKCEVEGLLQQRKEAKEKKEFATSDAIRDRLLILGVAVMDTPNGVVWEKL